MAIEQFLPAPAQNLFSSDEEKIEKKSLAGFFDGGKNEADPFALTRGTKKISNESARAIPGLFLNSARLLGYDVPESLVIYSGEMFYKAGHLEDVRIFGFYMVQEAAPSGGLHLRKWTTPEEPRFFLIPGHGIALHPSDKHRAYIAYSKESGGPYLDWHLDVNEEEAFGV